MRQAALQKLKEEWERVHKLQGVCQCECSWALWTLVVSLPCLGEGVPLQGVCRCDCFLI